MKSGRPRGRSPKPETEEAESDVVLPTPERLAKARDYADTFRSDTGREVVRVSVVDWLFTHERITGEAYSAAYRLLEDWHRGGLAQRATADTSRDIVDNGGTSDAFDVARMTAARHYVEAIAFVGPVHSHPIHMMVEQDISPVRYGQDFLRWRDRAEASAAAKQRLADALERLAGHYGLAEKENPGKRHRSYIAPGAKPVIL